MGFQTENLRVRNVKWKRVLGVYSIALVIVSMSLMVVPVFAQYVTGGSVIQPSEAENTTIHEEAADQVWQRTARNDLNFTLNTLIGNNLIEIKIYYFYNLTGGLGRDYNVTYKIYSNKIQIKEFIEYTEGGGTVRIHGYIGPYSIQSEALKLGENTISLLIIVNSSASRPSTSPYSFHLEIKDIQLKGLFYDKDSDGISDNVDPVANVNNMQLSAIIMLVLFPPITATGIERKRR
jgi:hypothetical protein